MVAHVGLDPNKDINWVDASRRRGQAAVRRGQGRRLPRLSAGAAGAARQEDRPRDRQQRNGPAVVAVLLLHGGRATGTSSASIRSRPSGRCAPSSRRPTSAPPSRSGPRGSRDGGFTQRYDYALQTLKELPYNSGGSYDPEDTLRFYALRLHEVGMIKSTPAEAHRRGHRLALPERAEEGAEGVNDRARIARSCTAAARPRGMALVARRAARPRPSRRRKPPASGSMKIRGICVGPAYMAEELLRVEGFTDVQYVADDVRDRRSGVPSRAASSTSAGFVGPLLVRIDARDADRHAGRRPRRSASSCSAPSASDAIRDLRGKTSAFRGSARPASVPVAAWRPMSGSTRARTSTGSSSLRSEGERSCSPTGKVDAFLGFPPEPQELRAKEIGHVDRQQRAWTSRGRSTSAAWWSATASSCGKHPVATKRALRAILKASDLCAAEPERVARSFSSTRGYVQRYDYALQTLSDVPYDRWREYDPEDTRALLRAAAARGRA